MSTYERALRIAVRAHHGQQRWCGEPYILHPLRVVERIFTETPILLIDDVIREELRQIAVLHDVVEDTPVTCWDLLAANFREVVVDAIETLTRKDDMSYVEYIKSITGNAYAVKVKVADLQDNLSTLTEQHGLWHRYTRALEVLGAPLCEL